jgi:hypothetical protein
MLAGKKRKPTLWPLTIDYFDRMPREARRALSESKFLGIGDERILIARARGSIMAARIRLADSRMQTGDNLEQYARGSLEEMNAILQGRG